MKVFKLILFLSISADEQLSKLTQEGEEDTSNSEFEFSSNDETLEVQQIINKYSKGPNRKALSVSPKQPSSLSIFPSPKSPLSQIEKPLPFAPISFGSTTSTLSPIVYFPFIQDRKWIVVFKEIPGMVFQIKPGKHQLVILWTIEGKITLLANL